MANRTIAIAATASLLLLQCGAGQQARAQYQDYQPQQGRGEPYRGDPNRGDQYRGYEGRNDQGRGDQGRRGNQMGYRMLSSREAASLPPAGASVGLSVESTQRISEQGLDFSVLRVIQVRPGSPAAAGGIQRGDNLIAVNGLVFPGIREFAQYVGSLTPGTVMSVDFIPAGTRPDNAHRVSLRVAGAGPMPRQGYATRQEEPETGMSTRMKLGLGAAALFGCYELGCFSSGQESQPQLRPQPQQGYPQQQYQR